MAPSSILTRTPPPGIPLEAHQRLCRGLLGDGTLEFYRNSKTGTLVSVRYREKHSAAQTNLVFNQQKGLRPLTDKITPPVVKQEKRDYFFAEVRTSQTSLLNSYGEAFYNSKIIAGKRQNQKILPENIGELLDNSLSPAIWIAGDVNPHGRILMLCRQSFTVPENEKLKEALKQNFGVNARVVYYKDKDKYLPQLYLQGRDAAKLVAQCDLEIRNLPSLKHKFYL